MKTITYAVDQDTGQVWSRLEGDPSVGSEKIAVPVLDYLAIGRDGDFSAPLTYNLERMGIEALIGSCLRWTRKIPTEIKNAHRRFWGMKPLRVSGGQQP